MMASSFGVPLVMATVFTLGGILIQTAGKRAEAITEGLGFLFLLCVLLNAIGLLAFFAGPRAVNPGAIRAVATGPSEPAETAARPILPASRADEPLKSQANFWNAPCLSRSRVRREDLSCR